MSNKLSPEDLQIHDLVYYDPNVFIDDEYVPTKDIETTSICSGDDIALANEGCYHPIPFREEFLTKENGFERIEGFTGVFYRHDDSLTVKEYDDAFTVNLSDRGWNAYLRFRSVHEFQHILRIIGYKDIANSFTLNQVGGVL